MPEFTEEIVYTTSEDGFLLEGVKLLPLGEAIKPISIVWIHGNAGRFYDYPYVMIGRALATSGYAFISANTRGHDISTFLWHAAAGGTPQSWQSGQFLPTGAGSAWDHLADAPRDLAAWVDMASGLAAGSVVLAGHSSGAQRLVLYQEERHDERVSGLVLASPDLVGFMPPAQLDEAERLIADGRGMEVLPAQPFAPWYRQSAQNVSGRNDVLSHLLKGNDPTISHITSPMLAFFGTREPGSGQGTLEAIVQSTPSAPVETQLIADADHIYSGHESEVAGVIDGWICRLPQHYDRKIPL